MGPAGVKRSQAMPSFGESVAATVAAMPVVWVMIGVAAALAGALPRFAPFSWGVLLVTFLVAEIGPLTDIPSWVLDLSPFTHLSPLPAGDFQPLSAMVLTVVAVALAAVGFAAYRRRDVT